MTRTPYIRKTRSTRAARSRLPGGEKLRRLPTLLCAASYLFTLFYLAMRRDALIVRVLFVPAACFLAVTALRPLIGRQRPYDRFGAPPVGRYKPGKGKSMPSRHTASAAAIACAVIAVFPSPIVFLLMLLLSALIAALRVLSGQHYTSDVIAALALSFALSLAGYLL